MTIQELEILIINKYFQKDKAIRYADFVSKDKTRMKFTTGFTRLVVVSIVIAIPLALVTINRFLEGYAYHIRVNWWIFPLAALAALVVAWLTVSYESLKAAMGNPTKSLKSE